ncbi:MAG: hypothetical protein ACK4GN_10775 [Runella sp.]
MKILFTSTFLFLLLVQCKSSSEDSLLKGCASSQPTLIGKWEMTEFRYFGGCCPVIADSSWKKATPESYQLEFLSDGTLKVHNLVATINGAFQSVSLPPLMTTRYLFDGKEITLQEQILGGAPWHKIVPVTQLTTRQLTLRILVGKEGETNERRFVRLCQ